jgi:uncharacterized protein
MYYQRNISIFFKNYLKQYPIVAITGPRQSGKTTLAIKTCPEYEYVSLEDPDNLDFAMTDPRGFLDYYSNNIIIDEAQKAPLLFSYLQTNVDKNSTPGRYVLTGSQQFLLNSKISQSLAGRCARLTLLPLSLAELHKRPAQEIWQKNKLIKINKPVNDYSYYLYKGLYPRIHENNLDPRQFYRDYIDTYVTKDLQELLHVSDLKTFTTFLRMIAGRCGQKVNLTSLGNDLGISHTTIKRWLHVLEASYIIILLEPYYNNFNKRLIKTPKIYFLDPGLLCYLLRITNEKDVQTNPFLGGIFETFIISELIKHYYHHDMKPPIYFWQDRSKHEIDVILENVIQRQLPIEIKSAKTVSNNFLNNINYWLKNNTNNDGFLIYGGSNWNKRNNIQIIPWFGVS